GAAKINAQNASFDATLEFLDGTFRSVRGQQPEFDSKVKVALEASNQIDIVTPYLKPQDDIRLFPITLSVRIAKSVMSQEGNISFRGQSVNLSQLIVSPTFIVNIPPGKGEHKNPDNPNSTDPARETGPDWSHDGQEAIFYDCTNPAGW